jgi:hypothetical protein
MEKIKKYDNHRNTVEIKTFQRPDMLPGEISSALFYPPLVLASPTLIP